MFKNIIAYVYNDSETDFTQIHTQVKNNTFSPLDQDITFTAGFAQFDDDVYIIESDNRILLKVKSSSKNISEQMIRNLTDERIENAKKEKGVNKASYDIRDIYENQVRRECLKYTTPTNKTVLLLIDKNTHYIYANTTNTSLAENAIHFVRKVIGKLACRYMYFLPSFFENTIEAIQLQLQNSGNFPYCLRIPIYPSVATHNTEDVKIVLTGIYKDSESFIDLLGGRRLKSLELELVSQKTESVSVITSFILYFNKKGVLIIKDLLLGDSESNYQYESIQEECSSIMILVGRYMKLIINSLDHALSRNDVFQ